MSLAERLRSENFLVVRQALEELPRLPVAEALPMLEDLALEANPSSRCYSLDGMAKTSTERAKALAYRFLQDPVWYVRTGAIHYFLEARDPDAIQDISRILATDPDEITRGWAAIYLGAVGDESVLPVLMFAVKHDAGSDVEGRRNRDMASHAIDEIRARLGIPDPENDWERPRGSED